MRRHFDLRHPILWAGCAALIPLSLPALAQPSIVRPIPAPTRAIAKAMTIQNDFLRVTALAGGTMTVSTHDSNEVVLSCRLEGAGASWEKHPVSDPIFGQGERLESTTPDGGVELRLFPLLPFVLWNRTYQNSTSQPQLFNRVPFGHVTVQNESAANLQTLGTGGLARADKNPGSYVYLAVAQPQSRRGIVAAWLSHDRASGVLFPKIEGDKVRVDARSDYGNLRLTPGVGAVGETLAIGVFDDARLGLEAWADAVARRYAIKLPAQPVGYCTWYSDKYGRASDEVHLAETSDFAAKHLQPFGFDFVQIDDYWQRGDLPPGAERNGPKKNFSASQPDGPYPSGMKATADKIKANGQTAGIWFMPFSGTFNDPHFAAHQDWFVKRADGTPYETKWGGTSLDMTQPGARDYLRSIVARLRHDWGYSYFKMDGIYSGVAAKHVYINAGYKEDDLGDAVFFDPAKTNIEAFRDGLKLVRQTAGRDVFFLGCAATQNMRSFGASFGLVDAMRIGPDNSGRWDAWVKTSPDYGSRNYFLNGRVWYNDPDPFYVRASVTTEEARTMASWTALSGQLNSSSDWLPDLPQERVDILKRTMPSHRATSRPVDFFESAKPRLWIASDQSTEARRDVIGIFNWADEPAAFDTPLSRFGLDDNREYVAFDFWANEFVAPFQGSVKAALAPHSCRILSIRALLDHPQLLSTNRHITQGLVDVSEEQWSAVSQTLSGKSQIVKDDDYELRFVTRTTENTWKAGDVKIATADQAAGVQVKSVKEQDGLVRVTLSSPVNREMTWSVRFAGG